MDGPNMLMSDMTSNMEDRHDDERQPTGSSQRRPAPDQSAAPIVIVFNSVVAGLGGLYVATKSLTVTALAAVLVVILVFLMMQRRTHRP